MLSLATLPTPTQLMASTSEWSSPIFTDMLPFIYVICGLSIGIGLVLLLVKAFKVN